MYVRMRTLRLAAPVQLQQRAASDRGDRRALRMGNGTAYDLSRAADAHRDIEGRRTLRTLYRASE